MRDRTNGGHKTGVIVDIEKRLERALRIAADILDVQPEQEVLPGLQSGERGAAGVGELESRQQVGGQQLAGFQRLEGQPSTSRRLGSTPSPPSAVGTEAGAERRGTSARRIHDHG